jgi:hypothetical protein
MFRISLISLVCAAASLLPAATIWAQSDPFAGLEPEVRQIGAVIDSGDAGRITALLADGDVIKTAFPGDGISVAHEVAEAEIPSRVVSSPGRSDAMGTGEFRLIAVWVQARADATDTLLMASGISGDGTRQTTVFAVEPNGPWWRITAWGHVVDPVDTLAVWAAHGDLRLVEQPIAPRPPATGSAAPSGDSSALPGWTMSAGMALAFVGVLALIGVAHRARWPELGQGRERVHRD